MFFHYLFSNIFPTTYPTLIFSWPFCDFLNLYELYDTLWNIEVVVVWKQVYLFQSLNVKHSKNGRKDDINLYSNEKAF